VIEGLLGRKLGMVQVFDKAGRMRGATVIEAGPCLITQIRTPERDGYQAVQLGFGTAKRRNKPMRGHLKRLGDLRHLREFRVEGDEHKVGDRVGVEIFQEGDKVDVTGVSKGRGFAGGVKRHGFHGGPKTHGQSDRHRAPGSIGSGTTPGRVYKGLKMAGHMGDVTRTVLNVLVVASDPERNLLFVEGSVPGARNGIVFVRGARRPALKAYAPPVFPAEAVEEAVADAEPESAPVEAGKQSEA
jgi:large subunit ribosomal protein L3